MRPNELTYWLNEISKGVLDMKIGNTINLLLIILIVFGFVLSDYIQVREKITVLQEEYASLSMKLELANADLAICETRAFEAENRNEALITENAQYSDKILQSENTILSQQGTIEGMSADIQACQAENEDQKTQIAILAYEKESCWLQNEQQAEGMNENLPITDLPESNVKPSEIILGVILVAQWTITIAQKKRKPSAMQLPQSTDYIRLTPQERSLIIHMRRKTRK